MLTRNVITLPLKGRRQILLFDEMVRVIVGIFIALAISHLTH